MYSVKPRDSRCNPLCWLTLEVLPEIYIIWYQRMIWTYFLIFTLNCKCSRNPRTGHVTLNNTHISFILSCNILF